MRFEHQKQQLIHRFRLHLPFVSCLSEHETLIDSAATAFVDGSNYLSRYLQSSLDAFERPQTIFGLIVFRATLCAMSTTKASSDLISPIVSAEIAELLSLRAEGINCQRHSETGPTANSSLFFYASASREVVGRTRTYQSGSIYHSQLNTIPLPLFDPAL
ncbi:hypothetical protein BDD12DRAFT_46793 [Trichophaea hybrida]|nr:hypothetical protein BDD12DRAFT_46793 [Trichophaea hybrida]